MVTDRAANVSVAHLQPTLLCDVLPACAFYAVPLSGLQFGGESMT
jgi:hypothetical protein